MKKLINLKATSRVIRESVGTRKIDLPKRGPGRVIEGAESIETGFNSICMRFAPVLLKKHEKCDFSSFLI